MLKKARRDEMFVFVSNVLWIGSGDLFLLCPSSVNIFLRPNYKIQKRRASQQSRHCEVRFSFTSKRLFTVRFAFILCNVFMSIVLHV